VAVGKTQQMTATGTYDDGSKKNITDGSSWTTSDSTIATVDDTGLVTGVAPGSTTISATASLLSGSTSLTVSVADLKSISIDPTNSSITAGGTQQYTAIGVLASGSTVDVTKQVTWQSSDTSVATIASTGLATGQSITASGSTTITAKSGDITSNSVQLTVSPSNQ
jgi:uncharacterized protein YjdB